MEGNCKPRDASAWLALPGAQWQEGTAMVSLGPGRPDIMLQKKYSKGAQQIHIQHVSSVLKDK